MLNILILSEQGEGFGVAKRFLQEGHFVKYIIENTNHKGWPENERLQEINNCKAVLPFTDLCYLTSGGFRGVAEEASKAGKLVVGRGFQDLLTPGKYLYNAAMNLLGLIKVKENPDLPELLMCGWFNGENFTKSYLVQHYNRLLSGNRGPKLSSMGCVAVERETFLPILSPLLKELNYKGYFGVVVKCDGDEFLFKNFSWILNPCTLAAILECSNATLTKLIDSLTVDQPGSIKFFSTEIGIAINMLTFGGSGLHDVKPAIKHYWFPENSDSLGIVSARGNSIFEARRRVNRTLDNLTSLDVVYRQDVGLYSIIPLIIK